ncbi:MAG: HEAT repeat domain-containing protein [Spirochaetia bacterium]
MRPKKFLAGIILFHVLAVFTVQGGEPEFENDNRSGWKPESSLDEDPVQLQVYNFYARSADKNMKIQAAEGMERLAREGRITEEDPNSLALLEYLATEGVATRVRGAETSRYFPESRRVACRVLGEIGGETAETILLEVLRKDTDVTVLAEAVYSLGSITGVPREETAAAFTRLMNTNNLLWHDNNLAFALLGAVEKIAVNNGGFTNIPLFLALLEIPKGPFTKNVRRKAAETAKLLKDYDNERRK